MTGRLRPAQGVDQANADLARMAAEIDRAHPSSEPRSFSAVAASGIPEGLREPVDMVLTFATTIAPLVLLVTCANVAGVLQSRAMARVHGAERAGVQSHAGRSGYYASFVANHDMYW